ncbi:uncharacterized protein [Oryza sativa Japonica Group]|uniref:uncharacterized protein n=1 Tax=Oryza sativa subsp. japonica TaxID=39947 RepID=UPI00339CE32B
MVKTRNDPRDSNDASGSEEQTDEAHVSGASGSRSSPPPENPTVTQMMTMMMQQMQQHHHQMLQQVQQNQQFGPPPSHLSKLLDFLRIQPPTFSSTTNPMEANDWLRAIEKKLNLLQCNDQEKVAFATHQLQGPASAWWDNYVVTRPDATELISGVYEDFEKLVDKAIRQEEQRNKMDRKRKAAQISFPQGNNQKPRFMTGQLGGPSTLIVCQHRPYHLSNFNNDYNGGSHNNSKQHNHNSTPPPLMAPAQSDPPAVSAQPVQPKKGAVGKPGPCFNCGKHDHFAGKCPKLNRTGPRFIQACANHVSAEEAQAAPEVVLGTFPVNSYPATVLFDSGASHSFISKRFAGTHGLSVVELKIPMQVHTPGNDMRTAHYCPSVTIEIKRSPFLSNLILLESKDLDVILGMDWLTRNKGVIDCASRTITLTNDKGEKITFRSPALQKSVASLNQAAIEGQTETVEKSPRKLEDIPIVQEYPEVFPEDLTTMPPKREIEFRIDLAPGTAPIYKRPYRMAANELAEVKKQAEHQRPAGLLQPLQIPEWKWEEIGMDFITGLPRTSSGQDSIWVVVDRLTKVAHFVPVHTTYTGKRLAELYLSRIMCLHGVPKKIVSDRGSQFTSKFWQKLQEELGTRLNFSTAYHPQTDGQTERVNQILEDMLRACALDFGGAWDKSLPYAEFSYNNSYQASLQMAPFEALYGRKCRTPLFWDQTGERQLFGTEVLTEAEEKVRTVRERLRIAQSRQKSYADNRRRELTFEAGDYVYLRVTPLRGVHRFQTKGKLAPRFVGPYRILERRGEVAYQLELPSNMVGIHDVFHVSQLKKCLRVPEEQASSEHIDIQEDLTYVEKPIRILETSERRTRNKIIRFCKVQWSHHSEEEATWEREDELKAAHPLEILVHEFLGVTITSRMKPASRSRATSSRMKACRSGA